MEKEAVVTEEVNVSKRKVKDTEHVAGTVRKEQLKVEREGEEEHGDEHQPDPAKHLHRRGVPEQEERPVNEQSNQGDIEDAPHFEEPERVPEVVVEGHASPSKSRTSAAFWA